MTLGETIDLVYPKGLDDLYAVLLIGLNYRLECV